MKYIYLKHEYTLNLRLSKRLIISNVEQTYFNSKVLRKIIGTCAVRKVPSHF